MIGGISYFHTYAYDLLATNERIIAASCDAAIAAHTGRAAREGDLPELVHGLRVDDRWPSYEGQERRDSAAGLVLRVPEAGGRVLRPGRASTSTALPFTIVRPFNCVGIGERRALGDVEILSGNVKLAMSHVVPDLVQKVLKGQDPLHILGDGSQVRHYTYGGDLAAGIVTAMEHPAALNEDFNLSTSESTTVLELAEAIWAKVKGPDVPLRTVSDPPFAHDVQRRVPSVEKAERLARVQGRHGARRDPDRGHSLD